VRSEDWQVPNAKSRGGKRLFVCLILGEETEWVRRGRTPDASPGASRLWRSGFGEVQRAWPEGGGEAGEEGGDAAEPQGLIVAVLPVLASESVRGQSETIS